MLWYGAWRHRPVRRATIALLIALPCLGGGWLWLRRSPLVSVEHVRIAGVHGADAVAIDAALTGAARHMTTLDFSAAGLRIAVASYPQVRSVTAKAGFPHTLSITVSEQPPIATLVAGGARVGVAADGVLLGGAFASSSLPLIEVSELPAGRRVTAGQIRQYLTVLAAAPMSIRRLLQKIYSTQKGITVQAHNGLLIYFGDATRPHAKWLSFTRVVVASAATPPSYIDVRLPERPAAGIPGESATPSTSGSSLDPTSAALAASLAGAVGGKSQAAATSTSASPSETEGSPVQAAPAGEQTTEEKH
ncbi:MAG TPA: FtsQ-type POTRA domain-containing protein [Solirubrobacteraceae bacterium]|jgi:cell division septal protein FtsQ